MTRTPSPTANSPSSWVGYKDLARRQYERGEYEDALASYKAALNRELRCPDSEKQIILSNLVAVRLKMGGPAQARAAIDNAKQCIELNSNWSKGHVRLASAYIALGGHSNDACNALQRALSIDPGNSTARDMLVRELRRDHAQAASRANSTASSAGSSGERGTADASGNNSATYTDRDEPPRRNNNNNNNNHQAPDAVDDSLTWQEWLQFHISRATTWYQSQSDDVKTILKIAVVILVLYVAFGGRFGLGGNTRRMGNYGQDNVYDDYKKNSHGRYPYDNPRQQGAGSRQRRTSSGGASSQYDDPYDDYDSRHYSTGRSSYGGGSSRSWSPFDGGMTSMLLLSGLAFGAHRMGINPFHTMLMMNMMGGGRRGFRPRRGFGMGMGGFGRGFGGMGGMGMGMGGMGRMRYGGGRRRF